MALTLNLDWADPIEIDGLEGTENPVVSVDYDGKVLSHFDDDKWTFPGSRSRPSIRISVSWLPGSSDAKRLALLRLTHGQALGASSARQIVHHLVQLAAFCTEKKIPFRELHRHPQIVIDFCERPAQKGNARPSRQRRQSIVSVARIAYSARDTLGWTFLESDQIDALRKIETLAARQHPVIPRRIYHEIDEAAHRILGGYLAVADDLDAVLAIWAPANTKQTRRGNPANWAALLAERPRLQQEFDRYVPDAKAPMASYFSFIRRAAFWVIAAGSSARKSEILGLRRGCLRREWIGDTQAYLLTGSTTKTQDNPNAIWVVSSRVEYAIQALERLLDSYVASHPNPPNLSNHLFQVLETNFGRRVPPSHRRTGKHHFGEPISHPVLRKLTTLADVDVRITQEDWREAKQYTPDLDESKFAAGKDWPLAPHQIRRTVLVYAAACGLISQDSLSFQAKHQTWKMTAYYCRNYWHLANFTPDHPLVAGTRIRDAEEFTRIYADQYNQARSQVIQDDRLVSPYGHSHKQAVVEALPRLSLDEIRKGTAKGVLKRNTLGLCAQAEYCEWQKAITVRGCMTKSNGKPCTNAIVDTHRLGVLRAQREALCADLEALHVTRDRFALEEKKADIEATDAAITVIEQNRKQHAENT